MTKLFPLAFGVLLIGGLAMAQVRIGALSDDVGQWQAVVEQAQAAGLNVELQGYSESALYQQVYLWAAFGRAAVDLVEVPLDWLPQVWNRLLELSPYEQGLAARGVEVYRYAGRAVGVVLPWRQDAVAAVLLRSPRAGEAVEILFFLGGAPAAVTPAPPASIPVPLRLGPLTISKAELNLPGVDGSLEILAQAMAQALPQGLVTALSQAPEPVRAAITTVAAMFGIPLSQDGTSVQLVVEWREGPVPLAAGAREQSRSPTGLSLVSVPLSQLGDFLSSMAGRALIRPPHIPIPLAASEGANLVGASAFHALGITGAGVKIAIIDVGFQGLTASQARGDLPYSVITRDFTGTGIETGYYHGTAVAEIVYEIAPGATLYLIKIGNEVDLDNAITYCISQGIDIVNHSLGWYNTNFYDGTGIIGDMVRRATAAGILWVQAAGNDALRHWEGYFSDTDADGWLDTELTFTASAGDNALFYLTWDGWPQTADDYDLYLYGPGGTLVASSTKTQGGAEEPTERVSVSLPQSGTYRIRIQLASGSPKKLELFSIYQELYPNVSSSSIPAPGNAAEALAVAAIHWDRYTSGPAADYSSRGPTNDGRQKPDLSAPANVSTGVPYYAPFPGTSAAAPHVAGIAALLLSEDPSLTLSQLRSRLLAQCVAMADPNTYGAGRLEAAPQGPSPLPDLVVQDISYSPINPTVGSTVTFQITVRNQGGSPAGGFYVRLAGAAGHRNAYISGLGAGASHAVTLSLPLSASPETFTATADYLGQVAEANEANNTGQVTVTAAAPALSMRVRLDRASYQVGDPVRITVDLSRSAYVYLVELNPAGRAILVFPNYWEWDPRLPAGTTVLPRASYTIQASEPTGSETLYAFASQVVIPYFPTGFTTPGFPILSTSGMLFLSQVRAWLSANVPAGDWAEDSVGFTVGPPPNQAPTARFSYSPASPDPGDMVTFDASASSDPDGSITAYQWDFGDGTTGSGVVVNHAFPAAGAYTVTLTVRDDGGATDAESKTIQVGAPSALPGMPVIDRPGIYVWGDPNAYWHITVAGDPSWTSPRPFRVEVAGRAGSMRNVSVSPGSAPAPQMGASNRSLTWEGTVGAGWVDIKFRTTQDFLMFSLYLDLNGDGDPELVEPGWVYLRGYKVNPPAVPMIFGMVDRRTYFNPNLDFKIGSGNLSRIIWFTTIEELEDQAR